MIENTDTKAVRDAQKASIKDAKAKRMQAQLRANLQKRKGQARQRIADAGENDKKPNNGNQD